MTTYFNNTRLKTFRENPRVYYWKYETNILGGYGLDLQTLDKNMFLGELVHEGLAEMYLDNPQYMDPVTNLFQDRLEGQDVETQIYWDAQLDYVQRLLAKYDEWRRVNDSFTVLGAEIEGVAPIGKECLLCGETWGSSQPSTCNCGAPIYYHVFRVDLITQDSLGRVRILDHKTRGGSADAKYQKSWRYAGQMWGYCTGYEKHSGETIHGYTVNILRKLSLDTPDTKRCPDCRATKSRKPSCMGCQGSGTVPRTKSDMFLRVDEGFSRSKRDRWTKTTLDTIRRIEYERELFKSDPELAWPMNPEDYFRWGESIFLDLDYSGPQDRWWDPHPELLEKFTARTADYVDTKTLIREDMK